MAEPKSENPPIIGWGVKVQKEAGNAVIGRIPTRLHDREKNYSPALKRYAEREAMERLQQEQETKPLKPRNYRPNFMFPFEMPRETSEGAQTEIPMDWLPPSEPQRNPNVETVRTPNGIVYCDKRTGICRNTKGQIVKP